MNNEGEPESSNGICEVFANTVHHEFEFLREFGFRFRTINEFGIDAESPTCRIEWGLDRGVFVAMFMYMIIVRLDTLDSCECPQTMDLWSLLRRWGIEPPPPLPEDRTVAATVSIERDIKHQARIFKELCVPILKREHNLWPSKRQPDQIRKGNCK